MKQGEIPHIQDSYCYFVTWKSLCYLLICMTTYRRLLKARGYSFSVMLCNATTDLTNHFPHLPCKVYVQYMCSYIVPIVAPF